MQDKDFAWVLRQLHSKQCILPILDTTFFCDNILQARYISQGNKPILRLMSYQSCFTRLTDRLKETYETYVKNSELKRLGPVLGYYIFHNKRHKIDIHNYPEVLKEIHQSIRVPVLQVALPQENSPLKEYTFEIYYTPEGFVSTLKRGSVVVKNHMIFDRIRDIVNVIVNVIENSSKKRLLYLEMDLFEDNYLEFWIGRTIACKVINTKDLSQYTNFSKIEILKIRRKSKNRKKTEKIMPHHLKILSPEHSYTLSREETPDKTNNEDTKNYRRHLDNRKNILSRHFIEMISKTNMAHRNKKWNSIDLDYGKECGRIFGMFKNSELEIRRENQDFVVEDIQLRKKFEDRPQFFGIIKPHKTPEQAYHPKVKLPKTSVVAKKKYKPKIPKNNFIKKRKALLIEKNLKSQTMKSIFSPGFSRKYSQCFKPIRLVKSHSTLIND